MFELDNLEETIHPVNADEVHIYDPRVQMVVVVVVVVVMV